jgi:hypothetical protein
MKTSMCEATMQRNLAETRETKLGCAMGVDVVRQNLAHLSSQRCQQPLGSWHAEHAQPLGEPKGKPANGCANADPRALRTGRSASSARLFGIFGRAVFGRYRSSISRFALSSGRSNPATRTAGAGSV